MGNEIFLMTMFTYLRVYIKEWLDYFVSLSDHNTQFSGPCPGYLVNLIPIQNG